MRPTLHPRLVNGRFGDPAVFVEALHRSEALLFDLGDLSSLANRDLLRLRYVCVSHMHMDHFIGFDRLLRVHVGRDKRITVLGPSGIIAAVEHKLRAYSWDLVDRYSTDLTFEVVEVHASDALQATRFRLKDRFAGERSAPPPHASGPTLPLPEFELSAALLEHHGPCLGFAIQEPLHVNVWRNRLEQRGLAAGPWLQALKRATAAGADDEVPIALPTGASRPLGELRDLVSVERGQKVAYVTDVADTPENRSAIAGLARDADILFIEASFAAGDSDQAAHRAHLTTRAAGEIGREAGARRIEPFHFSPRYEAEEDRLLAEVGAAFGRSTGQQGTVDPS